MSFQFKKGSLTVDVHVDRTKGHAYIMPIAQQYFQLGLSQSYFPKETLESRVLWRQGQAFRQVIRHAYNQMVP